MSALVLEILYEFLDLNLLRLLSCFSFFEELSKLVSLDKSISFILLGVFDWLERVAELLESVNNSRLLIAYFDHVLVLISERLVLSLLVVKRSKSVVQISSQSLDLVAHVVVLNRNLLPRFHGLRFLLPKIRTFVIIFSILSYLCSLTMMSWCRCFFSREAAFRWIISRSEVMSETSPSSRVLTRSNWVILI